mgnify:FL=1
MDTQHSVVCGKLLLQLDPCNTALTLVPQGKQHIIVHNWRRPTTEIIILHLKIDIFMEWSLSGILIQILLFIKIIYNGILHQSINQSINQSIQFWSGFVLVSGGGQIYPTLTAISPIPTLHLAWFIASFFSKPTLLLSLSAYPCRW